jgi:hypothetical protein
VRADDVREPYILLLLDELRCVLDSGVTTAASAVSNELILAILIAAASQICHCLPFGYDFTKVHRRAAQAPLCEEHLLVRPKQ